jgi:apolipoprotein N-acyltransferase
MLIFASLCAGIGMALSFPGWGLFPLAWIALVPLFWATERVSPGRCAAAFFVAGWIFYSLLLHWLLANVYWAGGWAVIGYQALCLALAAYWAGFGALRGWLGRRNFGLFLPVVLALLWALMEGLQGVLFTGFGWGALAYSQGPNLLAAQAAAYGGTGMVSAAIIAVSAYLALGVAEPRQRIRANLTVGAILLFVHALGLSPLGMGTPDDTTRPYNVGVVQPDFPLEMKWDHEYTVEMVRNTVEKSRALAATTNIDLFVWPESLVMTSIEQPEILDLVQNLAMDTGAAIFTGTIRSEDGQEFNSSALIGPDGMVAGHYDKVHLAPFGEYVPLGQYLPFIQKVVPSIGSITPGREQRALEAKGRTFGPLICFEVLFPALAWRLAQEDAEFLVVMTNLGWFGASSAIEQEINIARFRAIETRLPVIHSANTGLTGLIDPWGRFHPVTGTFTRSGVFTELSENVTPGATIMHRTGGVYALPLPANRFPTNPTRAFVYLAAIVCAATMVAALGRRTRMDART